jgi:ubiquinone/menaquinone biosynthesis C-methylase UbiE
MPDTAVVTDHYTHGSLLEAIRRGVGKLGKTIEEVEVEDLGPVDEFHIGGREATRHFLDQLKINDTHHVLDIGCGLGGASRFAVQQYGCHVTGIDLTREYVDTGNTLCQWVELDNQVQLKVADATALPFPDDTFQRAYLMHVGMNIADKDSLVRELYRAMQPGGRVGIYDIMQVGEGELLFPVPWAADSSGSSVSPPTTYKNVLTTAGFNILSEQNRRDFALEFFAQLQATLKDAEGPPPLGLHLLMGDTAAMKIQNVMDNISRNIISPVEIIAEKPTP